MQVILTEMGYDMNEVVERTGRDCMVLLLGPCGETTDRMIVAVKRLPGENKVCKEQRMISVGYCLSFLSFSGVAIRKARLSKGSPETSSSFGFHF